MELLTLEDGARPVAVKCVSNTLVAVVEAVVTVGLGLVTVVVVAMMVEVEV